MNLLNVLREDLKKAQLGKKESVSTTLRMLLSEIHNLEIKERKKETGLTNEEIIGVVRKEMKKRNDAIEEYQKAKREDLVAIEKEEITILEQYVPPQLQDENIQRVVEDSIREVNASGMQDFGKVMKVAMASLKGKAAGERIGEIVKKMLGNSAS
ncbi:MAG: hypothetical protein A3C80_03840 [Candidatus Ryanbacteria bacterium RIFCSPHIGHO2_02_FULL_45_43]|uniref:Glutamyl-tRNA amidotransferase n=1 Tax=Candidatus Ryanbacteria bacterium RIFCSPHIGHO2_01_45_13 TaxID=1802112 RepID=A0A1G2FZ56_9BACT|nr:MAG: hypothetical protein A2718_03100 [Candidatus Ryanbacteria bacterium RIFCSPHIGHO2_01_FULL_44_130]OGZ43117.1 MAG: hypothetical protein A2W41_00275 [Candidatus Ryanbacteria bacterium RIFCSPHIGHO2_01_45_13]OGZ47808.1 MAG: hypothetical protein A3C80_03840 [Candidatus Ryanbacteria bacterium RIFCSPHIGHO2_02_FULL_45_43]OGZ49701.1 MAG: hypothetical protein A3E55_02295 [Candidatus Ryanbacteria bacterium RIFCSPHIGHO2_12_FULL_44_20]OGZ52194.1 MAG: hypothetical protein A3A17_03160 [Candidatus Ryanba